MSVGDHEPAAETLVGRDRLRFHLRKLQRHPGYRGASRVWRIARTLPFDLWRIATHPYRELPSAVIAGAQKAGTTQLHEGLLRHPCCFGGVRKELNYFSHRAHWPLMWYRSRFPLSRTVGKARGICLEASPSYLPSLEAHVRMQEVLPEAKIIVILRDPVARAFSHYQHQKTRHRDRRSFAAAVGEIIDSGTLAAEPGAALAAGAPPMLDYISRGYYALQLESLWQVYPREQTLILDSAELFEDTSAVCHKVFRFLGLEPIFVTVDKIYNRGYYRETIDPGVAEELRAHYRPHDELLASLTGQTFRWMETSGRSAQSARGSSLVTTAA
jgi:Sulfotransferase domain